MRMLLIAAIISTSPVYGLTVGEIVEVRPMIEIGYIPCGTVMGYDSQTKPGYDLWAVNYHEHELYTILAVRVILLRLIYTGGEISVIMKPWLIGETFPFIAFDPQFVSYKFEVGIEWRELRIFYEHECSHPQITYPGGYRLLSVWGEGSVDRIGIRIGGLDG